MSKWFKLDVSSEAYSLLHAQARDEKTKNPESSKSALITQRITEGMRRHADLPEFSEPRKQPSGSSKTVQIDKGNHAFFVRLDSFVAEKNFYSRHFAARYCLYSVLGLPVD